MDEGADPRHCALPLHPNSGLPEFGTLGGRSRKHPTSTGERVGVRGFRTQLGCNPSPGVLRASTSPYGRGESVCGSGMRAIAAILAATLSILLSLLSIPAHAQLRGH